MKLLLIFSFMSTSSLLVIPFRASALISWNNATSCPATLVTLRDILGSQQNTNGGATFDGGYNASIPDKRSINPPCTVNGKPMLVEIHNVVLLDLSPTDECGDSGYSPAIPSAYCDSTGNVEDQNDLAFDPNKFMVRIHTENDMNWKYHSISFPNAPIGVPIDVQGFVFWDTGHLGDSWHSFSGWELHPLTGWRLSSNQTQPLFVSFTFSPTTVFTGGVISFSASASGGNPPYNFSWSFGGGSTATGSLVNHIFNSSGSFNVVVNVTDSGGNFTSSSNNISVSAPPQTIQTNFVFIDPKGNDVSSKLSWKIWDGTTLTSPGLSALLDPLKTYDLRTFYQSYLVDEKVFTPQAIINSTIYIYSHNSTPDGVVVFNQTIEDFLLGENSGQRLSFDILGPSENRTGDYKILIKVPNAPVSLTKNAVNYPFTFDSGNSIVVVETIHLSKWDLFFSNQNNSFFGNQNNTSNCWLQNYWNSSYSTLICATISKIPIDVIIIFEILFLLIIILVLSRPRKHKEQYRY